MNPIIIDEDTGHRLWSGGEWADRHDIVRPTWTNYFANSRATETVGT